jgi:predicted SnoaL-like aldol condensation-catalyzing enzyme
MSTPEQNKAAVRRLFDAFRAGDLAAFDDLIVESYVQHNPQVVNGREPVKAFFASIGKIDVENHRIFAEGDFVVAHSHYKTFNMAGVDIWRFNAEGKIVEHWDVLQEIPATTASGNDMFSQLT